MAGNPSLFQINTRVEITRLARVLGREATLDDFPDAALDRVAELRMDWVWLLGVWQTGLAGRSIALHHPELRAEYERTLPDLRDADICSSCFAVVAYQPAREIGGEAALTRFRERLARRGLKLMLDFVPNHTALDHPWALRRPELYVRGTQDDLARDPHNWVQIGEHVLAHGRDPNFPGWTDTLQLDYGNPALQAAMRAELLAVAQRCEAVRCDMAMLLLPEVFERTWGVRPAPFWPEATAATKAARPGFTFLAEAYWDLEAAMHAQGFDYAYDKRLYDRLHQGNARLVRDHLRADVGYQQRLARFLENHDERRAAEAFPPDMHRAAAIVTFLAPGLRFFHQGQFEGKRKRVPMQLCRAPEEPVDAALKSFYDRLLRCVGDEAAREGEWRLVECREAWAGNASNESFIAFALSRGDRRLLIIVNYAPHQSQCYAVLPFGAMRGAVRLADAMSDASYEREGERLSAEGLYLDMPAWGYHVFELGSA